MRTGDFDERAQVRRTRGGQTTFALLVAELGVDAAIREVETCLWVSESDWIPRPRGVVPDCVECLEVAHS